ncbi:MAG: hypothetical protein V8S97_02240 [Oscillospiraceae bacterium]
MPKYDSLLLNCGGGIINRSQKSKQYRGAAALAIGIGGTGVAALAELKQKVYQQLEPDNPDSPGTGISAHPVSGHRFGPHRYRHDARHGQAGQKDGSFSPSITLIWQQPCGRKT